MSNPYGNKDAVSPKKDLNKLNTYATEMKIAGVVRKYLEVLL